jgi:hypothetical protein
MVLGGNEGGGGDEGWVGAAARGLRARTEAEGAPPHARLHAPRQAGPHAPDDPSLVAVFSFVSLRPGGGACPVPALAPGAERERAWFAERQAVADARKAQRAAAAAAGGGGGGGAAEGASRGGGRAGASEAPARPRLAAAGADPRPGPSAACPCSSHPPVPPAHPSPPLQCRPMSRPTWRSSSPRRGQSATCPLSRHPTTCSWARRRSRTRSRASRSSATRTVGRGAASAPGLLPPFQRARGPRAEAPGSSGASHCAVLRSGQASNPPGPPPTPPTHNTPTLSCPRPHLRGLPAATRL